MLLLEMGANMEDSDDEVYTPIMEASRESHEEMAAGDCSDMTFAGQQKRVIYIFQNYDQIRLLYDESVI